ncbi:MAG: hypothetical protein ACO1QR_05300 [Chthoniobacteraceae bacterium]
MSIPSLTGGRLSFAWSDDRRRTLWLFAFILLSLFAHAATFFLFQISYPQQVTIPAPAPTVSVLDPSRDDHQAVLRWVAAADPALSAISPTAEPKGLLQVEYRPSFSTPRTPLRFIPAESETVRFPAAIDAPQLIGRLDARESIAQSPLPKSETRLVVSGPLAARALVSDFSVQKKVSGVPQNTKFLVGVTADGVAKFSFLQSVSAATADPLGVQAELDAAAASEIRKLRFAPADDEITWGMLMIEWGDDVFADEPADTERQPK